MTSYQLVKLSSVCKSYGPKIVLDNVFLTISRNDRIAFIGENGVGKSTLARLIAHLEVPDSGTIETAASIRIGYLPQQLEIAVPEQTVGEFLLGRFRDLFHRKSEIEDCLSRPECDEAQQQMLMQEWDRCHEELEARGGYDMEYQCHIILDGLGLSDLSLSMRIAQLSGGQKSKAAFASLLLTSPDLLILDEPTNHLDIKSLEWLEAFLDRFKGAVLLISHDRKFLNRVGRHIAELSAFTHSFAFYTGNYDDFLEEKHQEAVRKIQEFEAWKEEKKALYQLIKAKTFAAAKPSPPKDKNVMSYDHRGERHLRSTSRILRQAQARLNELEGRNLSHPVPKGYKGISFDPLELASAVVVQATGLTKAYGDHLLFKNIDLEVHAGDRIVLQGENGCGKTTLLEILLGITPADQGIIKLAPAAKIGYLDQNLDRCSGEVTVGEELVKTFGLNEADLRNELHKTGLADEGLLQRKVKTLSLGQKKRLSLLNLMLSKCNVLFLDEPTNHLDLLMLESLEAALRTFPGTIIAISHDRTFTERIATSIWKMEGGKIWKF
jgi:ATP-binding cassette, subfamily F, member 3